MKKSNREVIDNNDGTLSVETGSNGLYTIISKEDEWVLDHFPFWCVCCTNGNVSYVMAFANRRVLYLHRVILANKLGLIKKQTKDGILQGVGRLKHYTDHIDHDGLNNTRENLRPVTPAQNQWNKRTNTGSLYKGVRKTRWGTFHARICYGAKQIHLGTYKSITAAARRYNREARKVWGQYACLNAV